MIAPAAKPKISPRSSTENSELMISNLLRYGVLTSLSVVMFGTVLSFIHHPAYIASSEALSGLTSPTWGPHDLADVRLGLLAFRGQAVVTLGLLILISIPVARVALSLVLFVRMRDRRFVLITSIVLCFLLLSFFIGAGA